MADARKLTSNTASALCETNSYQYRWALRFAQFYIIAFCSCTYYRLSLLSNRRFLENY